MIRLFFLSLLILHSSFCLGSIRLELSFSQNKVKQGNLEEGLLKVGVETAQSFSLQKLKGQTLDETLYFQKLSPLIKKNDNGTFYSEVNVILLKEPKGTIIHNIDNQEISVMISDVEFIPTQVSKSLIFEEFSIPARKKLLKWLLVGVLLLAAFVFGLYFRKKWKSKQEIKKKKLELKEKILSASRYEDVVLIWQNKLLFTREFPHLEDPFKELEKVLFKYQFKKHQDESEKKEVMKAYRDFINLTEGGFSGI